MLSETWRRYTRTGTWFEPFSPLLVGVLSETRGAVEEAPLSGGLSVPYWSGCSVKRLGYWISNKGLVTFSPLLVGVLSETHKRYSASTGSSSLSVPYWSGCSVKQMRALLQQLEAATFSPLLVGVLSETSGGATVRPSS